MPIPKVLALAVLLSLAGCQHGSMPLAVDPPKKHVDAGLLADCNQVVDVPHRDLGLEEATRLWTQDRISLGDCRKRHKALSTSVKVLVR